MSASRPGKHKVSGSEIFAALVRFYRRERGIQWRWQAVDSRSCAAPLGGSETGKNPTNRAKLGSKIHLLVDQRGAPLAIDISGANQHDKWSVHALVVHVAVKRPTSHQHFCGDKGYDFDDVRQTVAQAGYVPHIKRKRRRGEPLADDHPAPGETQYPHAVGWSSGPLVGWSNGVAYAHAGVRNQPTGWLSSSSPVPASCVT